MGRLKFLAATTLGAFVLGIFLYLRGDANLWTFVLLTGFQIFMAVLRAEDAGLSRGFMITYGIALGGANILYPLSEGYFNIIDNKDLYYGLWLVPGMTAHFIGLILSLLWIVMYLILLFKPAPKADSENDIDRRVKEITAAVERGEVQL